jgi:hypothetical protein
MWAITSYFNPMHWNRRRENYNIFRTNLPVPLVTVELSFDGKFELTKDDADVLVQISGGAILWQKERLLNIALAHVPVGIENVAWTDCDVLFENNLWVQEACARLQHASVVQLFSETVYLDKSQQSIPQSVQPTIIRPSAVHCIHTHGTDAVFSAINRGTIVESNDYGFGWAAKRSILDKHGFYDAMPIGSGDQAFFNAIYGNFPKTHAHAYFNDEGYAHWQQWARPVWDSVVGNVDCVSGRVYHLWHGDKKNRKYVDRHKPLHAAGFDPDLDIKIDANGLWEWARPRPDLEKYLLEYFASRQEDG